MRAILTPVRAVLTVVQVILMLAMWVVAWTLQKIVSLLILPFTTKTQRQDVCASIFRTMSMVQMDYLNPFWWMSIIRPFNRAAVPANRPIIFMMNHLSNSDPWTLIRCFWPLDAKFICKGSLFNVPFGGWCLENAGDLAVKFTKAKDGWGTEKGSVGQLMTDATALLRRNHPIAVFPEGVRSFTPDGDLNDFKPGFFDLAIKENAVIVPIAITGTNNMWPRGDWKFGFARGYASVGDHIETQGLSTEELVAKTRAVINEMRETHPDRKAFRAREAKKQ